MLETQIRRPPAFGDIVEAVDRADDSASAILEGVDIGQNCDARAARSFEDDLPIAHRQAGAQDFSHWRIGARKRSAVEAVHANEAEESFVRFTGFGGAAPELGGAAIVAKDKAVLIANIDGGRKQIPKRFGQPKQMLIKNVRW